MESRFRPLSQRRGKILHPFSMKQCIFLWADSLAHEWKCCFPHCRVTCSRTLWGARPVLSLHSCGYWLRRAHQNWGLDLSLLGVVWQPRENQSGCSCGRALTGQSGWPRVSKRSIKLPLHGLCHCIDMMKN